jgi:hypothetical protein
MPNITPAAFGVPAGGPRSSRIIYPSSDTSINDGNPTGNNDTGTTIFLGSNFAGSDGFTRDSLFTFRLSELTAFWPIARAVLTCPIGARNDGIGGNFGMRRLLQHYDPKSVTWNKRDANNNWATSGARSVGVDVSSDWVSLVNSTGSSTSAIFTMNVPTSWIYDSILANADLQLFLYGYGNNGNTLDIGSLENTTYSKRNYMTITRG